MLDFLRDYWAWIIAFIVLVVAPMFPMTRRAWRWITALTIVSILAVEFAA